MIGSVGKPETHILFSPNSIACVYVCLGISKITHVILLIGLIHNIGYYPASSSMN